MNTYRFPFAGITLALLPSGALWWEEKALLCVSDLHLGKSERIARRGGSLLPPYETRDTLARLAEDIEQTGAGQVICLGDSFDDLDAAGNLGEEDARWLLGLMAGRRWIWIEGNHDPGPVALAGTHLEALSLPPLRFRHIAIPGETAEISGHYHPKARVGRRTRPCLLHDSDKVILPAYGTFTGGLHSDTAALSALMRPEAVAVLLGTPPRPIPIPSPARGPALG